MRSCFYTLSFRFHCCMLRTKVLVSNSNNRLPRIVRNSVLAVKCCWSCRAKSEFVQFYSKREVDRPKSRRANCARNRIVAPFEPPVPTRRELQPALSARRSGALPTPHPKLSRASHVTTLRVLASEPQEHEQTFSKINVESANGKMNPLLAKAREGFVRL